MVVGNYNYHQIMFAVDMFNLDYEKLSYFMKIKGELNRIIACFEANKTVPLKMFASQNINVEGSCLELKEFITKQFETRDEDSTEKRFPGEAQLRGLVRSELNNYKKLLTILADDINKFKENSKKQNNIQKVTLEQKQNFIRIQNITPSYISGLLEKENGMIIWNSSIGKLIDILKIIIVLEINTSIVDDKIVTIICDRFVNSNRENYLAAYVEKVHKMMRNTIWLNSTNRVHQSI
jgi:hypothetical protein